MPFRFLSFLIPLVVMIHLAGCADTSTPTLTSSPPGAPSTPSPSQTALSPTDSATPALSQSVPIMSATSPGTPSSSSTSTPLPSQTGTQTRATFTIPPSSTPQAGLPVECAVLPGPVMVSQQDRFCFTYPENFTLSQNERQQTLITGPALDASPGALRASLLIEITPAPAGKSLSQLVDDILKPFAGIKMPIARTRINLGNEPAEILEVVPGREGSRDLLVLREGKLYRLMFMPSVRDYPKARGDVETLFRSVSSTFTWLR